MTVVSYSKMAELTEVKFELWVQVGSRNHVLDGVQVPLCSDTVGWSFDP